jgi:hypothetical protein
VTTEKMSAGGDVATRARQGQGADVRAVNTESQNASPAPAAPARKRRRRRRSKLPKKVLRVTTYERLSEYLAAFAEGHFHLLILVGTGGLAKSRSVRAVLGEKGCWIEGNATPFGMYVKALSPQR